MGIRERKNRGTFTAFVTIDGKDVTRSAKSYEEALELEKQLLALKKDAQVRKIEELAKQKELEAKFNPIMMRVYQAAGGQPGGPGGMPGGMGGAGFPGGGMPGGPQGGAPTGGDTGVDDLD